MDVEKKHKSQSKKSINQYMKKFFKNIACISLISFYLFKVQQAQAIIPYYYLPAIKKREIWQIPSAPTTN